MKTIKILLIVPSEDDKLIMERDKEVNEAFGTYPPIGLLYVATYLKNRLSSHVDIRIIDSTVELYTYDELAEEIKNYNPCVVGMTAFTPSIVNIQQCLKLIKTISPQCVTVLGGPHVTAFEEMTLELAEVDYAIMGYGEYSFEKLIQTLFFNNGTIDSIPGIIYRKNGVIEKKQNLNIINLDDIPYPDLTLVPYLRYRCPVGTRDVMASLISSRGCPFKCTFCNSPDKKYLKRSMENVIEEVKNIQGLGINEIFFHDDLFNIENKRVYEFCSLLKQENIKISWSFKSRVTEINEEFIKTIKDCGCERIHFGIETHTDESLKKLKKGITIKQIRTAIDLCYKYKINSVGSFMINLPGDTIEIIKNRFAFANSLKLDYYQVAILVAFNHTEIFADGVMNNMWEKDLWENFVKNPSVDFVAPIWDNGISRIELDRLLASGLKQFYFRPSYILQRIRNLHGWEELKKYIVGAIRLLKFK